MRQVDESECPGNADGRQGLLGARVPLGDSDHVCSPVEHTIEGTVDEGRGFGGDHPTTGAGKTFGQVGSGKECARLELADGAVVEIPVDRVQNAGLDGELVGNEAVLGRGESGGECRCVDRRLG